MKKLSNIDESVWGDIRRRGIGSSEKQEDTFNPDYIDFGKNTTVYWAIDNLQIDGKVKFQFDEVRVYNNNGWRLPTKEEVEQLNWDGAKLQYKIGFKYFIFPDGNKLEIRTNGEGGTRMWTSEIVEKYPTGAWGYGLNNAEKYTSDPFNRGTKLFVFLVKDKNYVSESVWNDIRRRGIGADVKQEDDLTNIKYLKPLDMGGSVLWADDDLSLKDGDCYFTFDEVFELVKNSGWRLPTLEEVAELDDIYKKGSFWENDDRFVFDGFPHQLVFFKKGLIYTSASDKPIDKDYYYCWTSTLFLNNNRFANVFTFNDGKPCHTPLNNQHNVNNSVIQDITNGKLCVRLVKDK